MPRGEAWRAPAGEAKAGDGALAAAWTGGEDLGGLVPQALTPLPLPTSITYNGSMDSPVPLYPTDCPPSYEAVMGLRGDSQVRARLGVGQGAGARA